MQITHTKTWNVPDDLMNELACVIITTAVEGGINYWGGVSRYKWGGPDQPRDDGQYAEREYAEATVHDNEDEDHGPWEIDAAKMTEAIVKIVSGDVKPFYNQGYSETFKDRLVSLFNQAEQNPNMPFLDADFDFDADDADSAMQIACLGEVVYG